MPCNSVNPLISKSTNGSLISSKTNFTALLTPKKTKTFYYSMEVVYDPGRSVKSDQRGGIKVC